MSTIAGMLTELAYERQRLESAKEGIQHLFEQLEQTDAYRANKLMADDAKTRIAELEDQIKQAAVDEYQRTGAKKQPGVTVKLFTVIKYDLVNALDWCRAKLPEALTLDRKLFENHAKAVANTQPVPCVEILTEARAQIASDLSEYLPKEECPDEPDDDPRAAPQH